MIELEMLERTFVELKQSDPHKAAEICYVLAVRHLQAGDEERARRFGVECLRLLDGCPMKSYEDCAARQVVLGGIALPSLFHQDVVRANLKPLKL